MSIVMIAAVSGAIYWGVLFGPKYMDHIDVKQAMRRAIAQKASMGSIEDIQDILIREMKVIAPDVELIREDITVTRNKDVASVEIDFEYTREVKLVPTDKMSSVSFHPVVKDTYTP
jgi:hypothetical protein